MVLQEYLNPKDSSKQEKETGSALFREGDKVMQIKNNYQLEWETRGKNGIPVDHGMGDYPERMEGSICENNHCAGLWTAGVDFLAGIPEFVLNNRYI